MDPQTRDALAEWARLFNRGEYFEAHEVLERPWLGAVEPEKTFLKGLIHAAVCLYQYRRGNGHGARAKYASCVRYLAPYQPRFGGVQVEDLVGQLGRFFGPLVASPPGTAPPPPTAPWPSIRLEPAEAAAD